MPTKKLTLKKKLFKAALLKGGFGIIPEFQPVELITTAEDLKNMSNRRKKIILLKADKMLKATGVESVLLTKECKNAIKGTETEELFSSEKLVGVPSFLLDKCFVELYEKINRSKRYKTLMIYDRELKMVSYNKLAEFCRLVQYITVYTENINNIKKIAEKLLNEYGIMISVKEYMLRNEEQSCGLIIDADKNTVRIADLTVDGAEFEIDTGGYNLDNLEVAACMKKEDLVVRNWLSGNVVIKCHKNKAENL